MPTTSSARGCWETSNSFEPNGTATTASPAATVGEKPIPGADRDALESRIKEYGFDSMERLINWRLYNETGGGLMAELGSHQMDACSIFLGKKHPLAVQGYGGKNFYGVQGVGSKDKQEDDREIDDHIYVTFEFPGPHYEQDPEGHLHRHLFVDQHQPPRALRRNGLRQPRHA